MTTINFDYPTEPIGGGNPYYRCVHCKRSCPEINGEIENHHRDCEWRMEIENKPVDEDAYTKAVAEYYAIYIKEHPYIRLGQYLCNTFNITDSTIFYEESFDHAMRKFEENYVL